jgi:hypothetical protein
MQRYGWIYNAKQIAEHKGIGLDEAWEITTLEALNTLAYLKEFANYQKQLAEDARAKHK